MEDKVPFIKKNARKCLCHNCPVQTESHCAKEKMKEKKFSPANVPGLYCSSGVAACDDLDTNQMCICGSCPIWADYDLAGGKPMGYFCRDGKAR